MKLFKWFVGCWDEEFVENIQITTEIFMKSKWNIKEAD